MEVRCYHLLPEVAPYRRHLNALSRASRLKDPFSTFSFIENFGRFEGYHPRREGAEPWFLIAFENNAPLAYLPMRRVADRLLGVESASLQFFASHDTSCPYLVCRPEDEVRCSEAFLRYLLSRQGEWTWLDFHQQLGGSALFPPPGGLDLNRYDVRAWPSHDSSVIPIRWDSLADYFQALGGEFRAELRRRLEALLETGKLAYVWSSDPKVTPLLFELLRTLERRTWRAGSRHAIDSHPDRIDYFRSLLSAKQPMKVQIGLLLLNGKPIGGSFLGDYEKGLHLIELLYDDVWDRVGAGAAVVLLTMNHAIEGQYRALNFLSGFSDHKRRWLAEAHPTVGGQLTRTRSLRHLSLLVEDWTRRWRPKPAPPQQSWGPGHPSPRPGRSGITEPDPEWIAALVAQLEAHGSWLRHHRLEALLHATTAVPARSPARGTRRRISRAARPTPARRAPVR